MDRRLAVPAAAAAGLLAAGLPASYVVVSDGPTTAAVLIGLLGLLPAGLALLARR